MWASAFPVHLSDYPYFSASLDLWRRRVSSLILAGSFALAACTGAPAQAPASAPGETRRAADFGDSKLNARVEELLKKMTLDEKVGQLVQYSAGQPTGPGTGRTDYEDMIAHGQIGSLLNVIDTPLINKYQHIAVDKSRLHIPILFGLDVIHGYRTEFPYPLAMASTWDPTLIERASRVAAIEASAIGIRWTFSPMVDIARDARWGRIQEGAGEDPYLGSLMAAAYVRGYQGSRLDAPDTMAACAKHYVGYGAAEGGRDYNSTEISEHTLREFYLPPFHAAVSAGTATLMSAFNSLNGVPSSANPFTLTQVLRKEWGFQGFVVSDWTSVGELIPHGIATDSATAARKGFLAGVDMDMASSFYHDNMAQLVHSGAVPEARINESVRNILRVKFALGLFDHPYADEGRAKHVNFLPESLQLEQTIAERSLVLLKNAPAANGTSLLPISKEVKSVALIGPLGDNPSDPDGLRPADFPKSGAPTFPSELAKRLGEGNVFRAKGGSINESSDQEIAAAVEAAKRADLAILTLGEPQEMSGEATSRTNLGLPGRQQELLEAVAATGKPVVLIVFSGRPLTIPWAAKQIPAILAAWSPGTEAGPALARTLFGEVNPSGKLVLSWPRSVGQEPLYYNALNTGRPAARYDLTQPPTDTDSKYVSRYIDELNTPQFPFGFGLSYTTYSYSPTTINKNQLSAKDLNRTLKANDKAVLTVEATVSNTGSRAGDETVQLYVGLRGTSTAQPVRALKGFQKIALAPGETKKVTFSLDADALAIWNDHNEFAAEPSKVSVWISPDSTSGSDAKLEILP